METGEVQSKEQRDKECGKDAKSCDQDCKDPGEGVTRRLMLKL